MNNYNKTWTIILLIATTLFTMVGAAMILIYQNYYNGLQYLGTALVFFITAYLIRTGTLDLNNVSPYQYTDSQWVFSSPLLH